MQTYSSQLAFLSKVRDNRVEELQSLDRLYGEELRTTKKAIDVLKTEQDGMEAAFHAAHHRLEQKQAALKECVSSQKSRLFESVAKTYHQKLEGKYSCEHTISRSTDFDEEVLPVQSRHNISIRNRSGDEFMVSYQGDTVNGMPAGWGSAYCNDGYEYTGWWTDGVDDQGRNYNWMSGIVNVSTHDGLTCFTGHLGEVRTKDNNGKDGTRYSGIGTQGRLFDWHKGRLQTQDFSFEGKFDNNLPQVPCEVRVDWGAEYKKMESRSSELKKQKQQLSEAELAKMKETLVDELQLVRVRQILAEYLTLGR